MYRIIGANQVQYGPVTADQLRQWIAEGRADANTQVQLEGTDQWRPLRDLPEFADSLGQAPPPSSAAPPPFGTSAAAGFTDGGRAYAEQQVNGPAIGLMITSVLGFLSWLLNLLLDAGHTSARIFQGNGAVRMQAFDFLNGGLGVVLKILGLLFCAFLFYAALKMKRLENHNLCVAASIIAMIPCTSPCCCILGIPIGIWALLVLLKPEVRSYFT